MIRDDIILAAFSELALNRENKDYFSKTRDFFSARLETYALETKKYLESAIIGEIGNNSFDHNVNADSSYLRGVYFNPNFCESYVLLADFGQGLLQTLRVVIPNLKSDIEAINVAFTQSISSRMPESRGNGLKFVLKNILEKSWSMYYHSGNAVCCTDLGTMGFHKSSVNYRGCMSLICFND